MTLTIPRPEVLRVRVGCSVTYDVEYATPFVFLVRAQNNADQRVLQEVREIDPLIPVTESLDHFGNQIWQFVAPPGMLRVRYDAVVETSALPDPTLGSLARTPVEELPGDVVSFLWPSRYCPSDLLIGDAWELFGHINDGWQQVQAICDWMHSNITYGAGSTSTTDSLEVYQKRRGVCRDFAHLAVTFCRALNIPARYVCGYLPDIGVPPDPTPMDFHAWFQAYLDGAWRTFDARHNRPRTGRVIIATGRDAVDGAWATVFGNARLGKLLVRADQVDTAFTVDPIVESQAKA